MKSARPFSSLLLNYYLSKGQFQPNPVPDTSSSSYCPVPLTGGLPFVPSPSGRRLEPARKQGVRALKTTPPLYLPIISLAPLRTNPMLPPLVLRKYYAKTDFQANSNPNIAPIIPASTERPPHNSTRPDSQTTSAKTGATKLRPGKMPSPIPAAHQTPFSPKSIERCLRTLINIRHPPHPPPNSPFLRVLTSELSNLRRSTLPIIKRALL